MKKVPEKIKKCNKCKKTFKDREDYIAMVSDRTWNPFESTYDLLTKPHEWIYFHEKCKNLESNPPKADK